VEARILAAVHLILIKLKIYICLLIYRINLFKFIQRMNARPTSFLLRDNITFSEQESRYLRKLHRLQKHQNQHQTHPPEFNHITEETQTQIIPNIEPDRNQSGSLTPSTNIEPDQNQSGSSTPSTPSTPERPPLIFNPRGWGPNITNLGKLGAINKVLGSPLETRSIDSMMEDAEEALAMLGL
jgi:hypothetical protein